MWISEDWRDYELLDCSGGEKLERWGEYILVRPEPQAIWNTKRNHSGWESRSGRYVRSSKGGGYWEKDELPENWIVNYKDLRFNVSPTNFKHTGLFPEQAVNWDYIYNAISSSSNEIKVLNLFAYTGAATVAAAAAGASVCHVDAAKGMVAKAKENIFLNELNERPIRWIVDDCVKFLEREIRRGRRYDAVLLDPPSYGRGPSGEIWKLENSLWGLLNLVAGVLSDNPMFVIISSYTTGLSPAVLTYMADSVFTKRFGGKSECRELGLPVTESGLILPCGAACRWIAKERMGKTKWA